MKAYRAYATVDDADQIVLSGVPFQPGQRVEILVFPQGQDRTNAVRELESLLKDTQALAQLATITEDEIAAEVAAFREGR